MAISLGTHTLTLKTTDQKDTTANEMLLTVGNTAPTAAAFGAGTYEIDAPVALSGEVSDFDGDLLQFSWKLDGNPLCSGSIAAPAGGAPIGIGACAAPGLALGSHSAVLSVSDGVNAPVQSGVTLMIVDTSVPTLAPAVAPGILWPPDHRMVDVAIDAHAADNGGTVSLSAAIVSNEPQEGLGDGDTAQDWTDPVIDQATGRIAFRLRAERSGRGDGRTYTVIVTATDGAGKQGLALIRRVVSKAYTRDAEPKAVLTQARIVVQASPSEVLHFFARVNRNGFSGGILT